MALTDRQRVLLMADASSWINVATSVTQVAVDEGEELADAIRDAGDSSPVDAVLVAKVFRVAMMNVHMIAIALRQIDRHLKRLAPEWSGDLAREGARFRTLYAASDMKDFRDVLEHSADYLVDDGTKPELKQSEEVGYSVLAVDRRIQGISVFGKTYDVVPLVAATTALLPLLAPERRA